MFSCSLAAQTPQKISYQAVIHNSNNQLVTNQQTSLRISILHDSVSGTAVYVENHSPTTNNNGLVSLEIGGGTVVSGSLSSINWSDGSYFIKTETDPTGGTNYSISGTNQLLSVPYAMHANTADSCINNSGSMLPQHYIGESYGGGIVFYLYYYENKQHGLIVSAADLSEGIRWYGGTYSNTMAYGDNTLAGKSNTLLIIANQGYADGETYAARICNEYHSGGYGDWYLPSRTELSILINERLIELTPNSSYWSSTEQNNGSAYYGMRLGSYDTGGFTQKTEMLRVRAIRAF